MKQISFIHAADLHLDSPMVGLKHLPASILSRVRESTFIALQKVTMAAIDHQVDFVIIAGDLFDGEDRSLRAQSRFRAEMLKLLEKDIPVYVIHGNHDHLNGSWVHLDMPPNVFIFNSKNEIKVLKTKRGDLVHLYGFSYPQRHVFERKIDDYEKVDGADFHIGILHGNEASGKEHDNYAPFSVKDLLEKQFDYWALGHIHKRTILSESPPIVYSGNIQGRNMKEIGVKGCYHVSLKDLDANMEFVSTSDIVWEEVTIDVSQAVSFQDIFQLCQMSINQLRKPAIGTLVRLHIKNVHLEDTREKGSLEEHLQELLLDNESEEESFVWVVDLRVTEGQPFDRKQLSKEANFYSELFETVDGYNGVGTALSHLYKHQLGRKYLSDLTEQEQKDVLAKAEKLLINLLYQ
ncbi:DNA repair exonuclease [Neobacillus sp. FSL H8-0543]|uniref:metallophosphoesterase family protein n=1 Tax=Neobacillus sp. FSL H8-0543 TaxID=2954672 RepID=UPI0031589F1B